MNLRRIMAVASLAFLGSWLAPANAAKFTMVISHMGPEDWTNNEMHPAMKHFEAMVEARTGGDIDVQVFGNGQLGFDPLHFAMVMILTLNVGNITPPVGMSLMTTARIAGFRYESAIVASLPFYVSFIAVIAIVSLWPQTVLWLPGLLK